LRLLGDGLEIELVEQELRFFIRAKAWVALDRKPQEVFVLGTVVPIEGQEDAGGAWVGGDNDFSHVKCLIEEERKRINQSSGASFVPTPQAPIPWENVLRQLRRKGLGTGRHYDAALDQKSVDLMDVRPIFYGRVSGNGNTGFREPDCALATNPDAPSVRCKATDALRAVKWSTPRDGEPGENVGHERNGERPSL